MLGAELVVETRGLTKRYGREILAVDALDLNVHRGEVYGFLGPNGAGKTTTLRMLLGLIRPTSGTARVAGTSPGAPDGLIRIGAIVETPAFYPYLSGWDNLKVMADYCGVPDSRIGAALDQVELTPRARHKFSTYSMGMKQRLGVAAALLKEPELLILDEPTNGLDPQGMIDMRNLIVELGKGSRTVLVSSHMLSEVEQMCTRIGVIQKGRLVAEGTMEELQGAVTLSVRAAPAARAQEILTRMLGPEAVTAPDGRQDGGQDGAFTLRVDPARAAEVNRALVTGGIEVSELSAGRRSLEDVFIELTGTESGL